MCEQGTVAIVKLSIPDKQGRLEASCDACILPLVQALNDAGIETIASCCGHGKRWGNIALRDGRELVIIPDYDTARALDKVHGRPINEPNIPKD